MNRLDCEDAGKLIERHLDGELGASGSLRLARHLERCERCRAKRDALQAQSRLLRAHIQAAVDEADFTGFEDRVMQGLAQQPSAPLFERMRIWLREALYHHRAIWITSLATAAILLAVLLPLLGEQSRAPQPEPGTPPARHEPHPRESVARANNELIIDSMEYGGQRSMIFTVSRNHTTVIWLYDFDETGPADGQGDDL
ncbi:MAG: zf-HC2 domain-containing protein [Deltaproteobacteria bacterium]|nr:zf-HC2 domain-containing protein [Deltaproteobacteria bacterium]